MTKNETLLTQVLLQEIQALENFIALLKQEEKALTSLMPEGLDILGEKKLTLLKNIEHLEQTRNQLFTESMRQQPEIQTQTEKLFNLAQEVQNQNQQNGKHLMRHLEHTQEALATLMQKEKTALYGSDGQTENALIGRNLGSA